MRMLEINKRTVYHAEPISEEQNEFGEIAPRYSVPRPARICVQYTRSTLKTEQYGNNPMCDVKLISSRDMEFDDRTVFWIDADTTAPHDYEMSGKPIRSVNGVVYPLRGVSISHAD